MTILVGGNAAAGKGTVGRAVGETTIILDGHCLTPDENVALGAAERPDVVFVGGTLIAATATFTAAVARSPGPRAPGRHRRRAT